MSGVFIEHGDSPTVYFNGCDPIQVESTSWHADPGCKQLERCTFIICAVSANKYGLVPGRFYRMCGCNLCHPNMRCEHCPGDDPISDLNPSCPHFLLGDLNCHPSSVKDTLHFTGDSWTPDEDRQALMSWPLEMYTLVLSPVHKIRICSIGVQANCFDLDARRRELWAERRANRSLFMYMLCCAAKASGCDLPRDLVRCISDAAWPLPRLRH